MTASPWPHPWRAPAAEIIACQCRPMQQGRYRTHRIAESARGKRPPPRGERPLNGSRSGFRQPDMQHQVRRHLEFPNRAAAPSSTTLP